MIAESRDKLQHAPNVLFYDRILENEKAGYLIRQYLYGSLYDRISTRPFLESIEKKWITYQLLCGLAACHNEGVHHGDIKMENVLVTSYNWAYLVDFAPFKPTYLPEDNPADFSFFFDLSSRRACYVAPERFLPAVEKQRHHLTDTMDIFSLGCVIGELFLEGLPLFTLSQLYKFRQNEYDPVTAHLHNIDPEVRSLIAHMTQLDPTKRFSAEQYAKKWLHKVFPAYFSTFLHQYIASNTDLAGMHLVQRELGPIQSIADDRLTQIAQDFDKISFFLGFQTQAEDIMSDESQDIARSVLFPVSLHLPNYSKISAATEKQPLRSVDGALIFLSYVLSSIRSTQRPSARVLACDLLVALSQRLTDESKLDRCLPYLVHLLSDKDAGVRIAAIRAMATLIASVTVLTSVNAFVFPEYIISKLKDLPTDSEVTVRAVYAATLASLVDSASRYLDMAHALGSPAGISYLSSDATMFYNSESLDNLYDISRQDLVDAFESHVIALLADRSSIVQRALLGSLTSLCLFFGKTKANDVLLGHLITYLNETDWELRAAFFEHIAGVAAFIGGNGMENYVLPLIVQTFTDPEEFVAERSFHSLSSLTELGFFQKQTLQQLFRVVVRYLVHPNNWIRQAAIAFISISVKRVGEIDAFAFLLPILHPYLVSDISDFREATILSTLRPPIDRTVYSSLINWAARAEKSYFWAPFLTSRRRGAKSILSNVKSADANTPLAYMSLNESISTKNVSKSEEDEYYMGKLRGLGISAAEEWKIAALRPHIMRISEIVHGGPPKKENKHDETTEYISIKDLGLRPQTVFFDVSTGNNHHLPKTPVSSPLDNLPTPEQLQHDFRLSQQTKPRIPSSNGPPNPAPSDHLARSSLNLPNLTIASVGVAIPKSSAPAFISQQAATGEIPSQLLSQPTSISTTPMRTPPIDTLANESEIQQVFAVHTYSMSKYDINPLTPIAGNDANVVEVLENAYKEQLSVANLDFGPALDTVEHLSLRPNNNRAGKWTPQCTLIAHLSEHTAAINRVVVSPDNAFFVTASDDGTVKIWDAARLEKNALNSSRVTYRFGSGTKVKALCLLENSHCIACAAEDQTIVVLRIQYEPGTPFSKYGPLKILRKFSLDGTERATFLDHFISGIA